jgi:NADH dehydrogenase
MLFKPPDERPHVVIVGAGFGGLYAAKALKNASVSVTLVDSRNHHLFQPLLYQVATAALSPSDIAYPIRSVVRRHKNTRVLLATAMAVDVDARKVILRDGEIPYDYLVLATGAGQAYFGHDEWKPLAPGLKSLEDALEIRRRILLVFEKAEREPDAEKRQALMTFMIVGGGPTGVELAGAIAEIARYVLIDEFRAIQPQEARVLLVEAGERILDSFPPDLSRRAEQSLRSIGVEVWTGFRVTAIENDHAMLGDLRVGAATTLWAAGVKASSLGQSLGVPTDRAGRVIVNRDSTIAGHSEVFVIGDLALFKHQGERPLPGVAPVAMQQGRQAAENIRRACAGEAHEPFRYRDYGNMATIGRASAVVDMAGAKISGILAWVFWLFVHILYLIGFRNRVVVMLNWAWSYFRRQRSARLITGLIEDEPEAEGAPPVNE